MDHPQIIAKVIWNNEVIHSRIKPYMLLWNCLQKQPITSFPLPTSLCIWLCSKCHQDMESLSPLLSLNWICDFLWAIEHSRGEVVQFWALVSRGLCVSAHLIGFLPCHENTSGLTYWRMRDHKREVDPAVTNKASDKGDVLARISQVSASQAVALHRCVSEPCRKTQGQQAQKVCPDDLRTASFSGTRFWGNLLQSKV